MTKPLWSLDVAALTRAYQKQTLTPTAVMDACLRQVAKYDPLFNAFCHLDAESARSQAAASTRRWRNGKPLVCVARSRSVMARPW